MTYLVNNSRALVDKILYRNNLMKEILNLKIQMNSYVTKIVYYDALNDKEKIKILDRINILQNEQLLDYTAARVQEVNELINYYNVINIEEDNTRKVMANLLDLQKKYNEKLHLLNIVNGLIPDQQTITQLKFTYA